MGDVLIYFSVRNFPWLFHQNWDPLTGGREQAKLISSVFSLGNPNLNRPDAGAGLVRGRRGKIILELYLRPDNCHHQVQYLDWTRQSSLHNDLFAGWLQPSQQPCDSWWQCLVFWIDTLPYYYSLDIFYFLCTIRPLQLHERLSSLSRLYPFCKTKFL